jgi:hypothetical protein
MATERQTQANRANAAKSTGPRTPEGKRTSSRNATLPAAFDPLLLKGQALRCFQDIQADIVRQFQPNTPAEITLVNAMTFARWRWLAAVKNQTACLNRQINHLRKMSRLQKSSPGPAFRSLACESRTFARQLRLEAAYDRQYNRALAALLKLCGGEFQTNPIQNRYQPHPQKGTGLQ